MNATEIKALWVYASQMWPNHPIPLNPDERVVLLQTWTDSVGDLDAGAIKAALLTLSSAEWFPPLGTVRERAELLIAEANGVGRIPDVDEAWAEVMQTIHRTGRYGVPVWSHPAIRSTVAALDWLEICNCTDLGVMRGQFARFYEAAKTRARRTDHPPPPGVAAFLAKHAIAKRVDDVLEIGPGS